MLSIENIYLLTLVLITAAQRAVYIPTVTHPGKKHQRREGNVIGREEERKKKKETLKNENENEMKKKKKFRQCRWTTGKGQTEKSDPPHCTRGVVVLRREFNLYQPLGTIVT